MTFSLAARDPATGAFGMVLSSSSPAVAARCLHLRPLVGVAASQNVTNPALGPRLLDLLQAGSTAEEAVAQVVAEEAHPEHRQLTVVDAAGRVAYFSGARALGTHAAATGHQAVAAGNMLAGAHVVQAMIDSYRASPAATFEERLLAGFLGGLAAGGEEGPVRSAGLAVVESAPLAGDGPARGRRRRSRSRARPAAGALAAAEAGLPHPRPRPRGRALLRRARGPLMPAREPLAAPEALKRRAAELVEARLGALLGISRRLHQNPESAWREHASAAFLADELAARGFAVERGAAGLPTAFVATYGEGAVTVGLVAEYDALPGLGHACGHNIIAATAIGAAEALAAVAADLGIGIRVVGTPAEEGGGGKIPMLEAGCFDNLAFAMMIHPGPADAVYARPRAVAHFDVSYQGVTSHAGAYPHLGRNAADAFTIAQVAIGLLRQQLAPSVRVHGIVTEAGTAANAIPDLARGSWYVRADTLAELDGAFARVRACFEAGALAAGCEWELTETSPRYAEFRNDERLAALFAANGAALGRDMDLGETGPRGMATASTDMGNVSQQVRAIHPYLGIGSLPAVNHQPAFAAATVTPAGDRAVRDGAVLLAQTAIDAVLAGLFRRLPDQVGRPLRDDHHRDDGIRRPTEEDRGNRRGAPFLLLVCPVPCTVQGGSAGKICTIDVSEP